MLVFFVQLLQAEVPPNIEKPLEEQENSDEPTYLSDDAPAQENVPVPIADKVGALDGGAPPPVTVKAILDGGAAAVSSRFQNLLRTFVLKKVAQSDNICDCFIRIVYFIKQNLS